MTEKDIELNIISISDLLKSDKNYNNSTIIDEKWTSEDHRKKCLSIDFNNEDIIYKNFQKECVVYSKNEVVKKVLNKKYTNHFNKVFESCKQIGIDTIMGYIVVKPNIIIFEKKLPGYPLICFTSTIDEKHKNTFENNHLRLPNLKLKLSKFFIFKLIYDILEELKVYHDKGYCHGDIHTGNILFDAEKYKQTLTQYPKFEHERLNLESLKITPKLFTLIDYDCVFISPDNYHVQMIGNSADYMISHNRVYHSDNIGDIQRLCSIINLLINKSILESPSNYEFLQKTLRFCKKIKKVDSSMTLMALDPIRYFSENIFLEKSIPRNIFSNLTYKSEMMEKYKFDIEFKNITSDNCYYVNTNSRKIGNDLWQLVHMNDILLKNNINVRFYYHKEVFTIDIPLNMKKEDIKKVCDMA